MAAADFIVQSEVRESMKESDVEIVLQKASESSPVSYTHLTLPTKA